MREGSCWHDCETNWLLSFTNCLYCFGNLYYNNEPLAPIARELHGSTIEVAVSFYYVVAQKLYFVKIVGN